MLLFDLSRKLRVKIFKEGRRRKEVVDQHKYGLSIDQKNMNIPMD